jgi:hypothetical protein
MAYTSFWVQIFLSEYTPLLFSYTTFEYISFSLWIELILIPVLSFLIILGTFAGIKKEYIQIKNMIDSILGIFGIFLIILVLYNIFSNYQNYITIDNLRAFILPPLLTFAFIPCLYMFSLIMTYELIFVRITMFVRDKELVRFTKRKIITFCHIRLGKLKRFYKENNNKLISLVDKKDILTIIRNFNKKKS